MGDSIKVFIDQLDGGVLEAYSKNSAPLLAYQVCSFTNSYWVCGGHFDSWNGVLYKGSDSLDAQLPSTGNNLLS